MASIKHFFNNIQFSYFKIDNKDFTDAVGRMIHAQQSFFTHPDSYKVSYSKIHDVPSFGYSAVVNLKEYFQVFFNIIFEKIYILKKNNL